MLTSWKRKIIVNILRQRKSGAIVQGGLKKLIPAFQDAAKQIPAYRSLLQKNSVNPSEIHDLASFQKLVPIIDKNFFTDYPLAELCKHWNPEKLRSLTLSSGFSGKFAFGVMTSDELESLTFGVDILVDLIFNTTEKKTFWISALGQGVKVYTRLALGETSVRTDSVLALLKKVGPYYDQVLIIGNTFFMKKIIEDGIDQGVDWKSLPVHFLMGEDWFPESYRSYLGQLVGADFDDLNGTMMGSTLGVSELGLSLFQESKDTVRIRRLAEQDPHLRVALFGPNTRISPILFHYHPSQIFLESLEAGLVFTILDRHATLPLVRYAPGDRGEIIEYEHLKDILCKLGYDDYVPRLQTPLVSVMGRHGKHVDINGQRVTPEEVKTGIYSNFRTAQATTGYFRLSPRPTHLAIEIQLRENYDWSEDLKNTYYEAIAKYISTNFEVILYPYKDFPYGMTLNYETKFKYL